MGGVHSQIGGLGVGAGPAPLSLPEATIMTRDPILKAPGLSADDYRAFCGELEESSGIVLGDNKEYLVVSRTRQLLTQLGLPTVGELLAQLRSGAVPGLRDRVIDVMTTKETSWFRDGYPFTALRQRILPELAAAGRNRLRCWSAACSYGQEAYSIAMVLDEFRRAAPGAFGGGMSILATDISPTALQSASVGRYDHLAMARGLSTDLRQRYFRPRGALWEVVPQVREKISFQSLNLLDDFRGLGRFEVIFCRNVLIYIGVKARSEILSRLASCLEPGGYLVLGGSEPLTDPGFEMIRHDSGLIYRRR